MRFALLLRKGGLQFLPIGLCSGKAVVAIAYGHHNGGLPGGSGIACVKHRLAGKGFQRVHGLLLQGRVFDLPAG